MHCNTGTITPITFRTGVYCSSRSHNNVHSSASSSYYEAHLLPFIAGKIVNLPYLTHFANPVPSTRPISTVSSPTNITIGSTFTRLWQLARETFHAFPQFTATTLEKLFKRNHLTLVGLAVQSIALVYSAQRSPHSPHSTSNTSNDKYVGELISSPTNQPHVASGYNPLPRFCSGWHLLCKPSKYSRKLHYNACHIR